MTGLPLLSCFVLLFNTHRVLSFCGSIGEESTDEGVERGVHKLLKSRLEKQDSFGYDSPKFQNLCRPLPLVPEEDQFVLSDIDVNEQPQAFNLVALAKKSRNQAESSRKGKKKNGKSKGSKENNIDESRPDSDQVRFERLQEAKATYRLQRISHQVGKEFRPRGQDFSSKTHTMARTRRNPGPEEEPNSPTNVTAAAPAVQDESAENISPNKQNLKRKYFATEESEAKMHAHVNELYAKDKKLSLKQRGNRIYELHCENYVQNKRLKHIIVKERAVTEELRQNIVVLKKDNAALEENNAHLQKDNAALKKKIARNGLDSQKSAITLKINQDILDQCKKLAKTKLWRVQKFISGTKAALKAADFVLSRIDAISSEMEDDNNKASLIKTYKTEIKKALYGEKNYVASELKKLVMKMFADNRTIPSVEDILKCASRSIETPEEKELFVWYWDNVLPKMVGSKEWDTSVKYYKTISEAKDPDNEDDRIITVSDEAMIVLMWDNSFERWHSEWNWEQDPENRGQRRPRWDGRYSTANNGQSQWGGWSPEAYTAYNRYFIAARDGRDADNCKQVEMDCLQTLRNNNQITEENQEMQISENRRLRRAQRIGVGLAIPARNQNIQPLDELDSEEEESSDEEEEEIPDGNESD